MDINLSELKRKFDTFNKQMFQGCLPAIEIGLCRAKGKAGSFSYKQRKNLIGKACYYDLSIRLSVCFNYTERELEDVLIHEMIHYYIFFKKLRDTSPHGTLFKQIKEAINARFGRNVTVSFKHNELEADETQIRRRLHIVALISFSDGKKGFKVLTRTMPRIVAFYNSIVSLRNVESVELFATNDVFFEAYPHSCSLRYHPITNEELMPHLQRVTHILCDGKKLQIVK